jgi:DNA-binding XRE family transcriptional regulator
MSEQTAHLARVARVLRAWNNWTVAEAAEKAGLSPSTIRRIESDPSGVHLTTLARLASAYGMRTEMLFWNIVFQAPTSKEGKDA